MSREPRTANETEVWQELSKKLSQLNHQSKVSQYDIAFIKSVINNNILNEKISNSYSGNAVDICIRSVAKNLVMYICRSWDNEVIPKIARDLLELSPKIESMRLEAHPDWPLENLEIGTLAQKLNVLIATISQFLASKSFKSIRIYRDEHLAHLLEDSGRLRKKFQKEDFIPHDANYNEIVLSSVKTAEMVSELWRIFSFEVDDPETRIKLMEENCHIFWKTLPVLAIEEKKYRN